MSLSSGVDNFAVRLEEADLAALLQREQADAIALLRRRVPERHVRNIDRRVLLHDAALLVLLRVRPRVTLDRVDAFDDDLAFLHGGHGSAAALIAPRDYDDFVALANLVHLRAPRVRER